MSQCSRCAVQELIERKGHKRVVELIHTMPDRVGWRQFQIWIEEDTSLAHHPTEKRIYVDGAQYVWCMTLFSEAHSNDEDCSSTWEPKRFQPTHGFPKRRLFVEHAEQGILGEFLFYTHHDERLLSDPRELTRHELVVATLRLGRQLRESLIRCEAGGNDGADVYECQEIGKAREAMIRQYLDRLGLNKETA